MDNSSFRVAHKSNHKLDIHSISLSLTVNIVYKTSATAARAAPPTTPQLAAAVTRGIAAEPALVLEEGALVPVVGGALSVCVTLPVCVALALADGAGVAETPSSFSRPAVIVTLQVVIKRAVGTWVVAEDLVDHTPSG